MIKYIQKYFSAPPSITPEKIIHVEVAYESLQGQRLDIQAPTSALISIHSAFHGEFGLDFKVNGYLSSIRDKNTVTVLLSDKIHMRVMRVHYKEAPSISVESPVDTYQRCFEKYMIEFWHSYIHKGRQFRAALTYMRDYFEMDLFFQQIIHDDAEAFYVSQKLEGIRDKGLEIEKIIDEILEQSACVFLLAGMGYVFQFDPKGSYPSIEYINRILIPKEVCTNHRKVRVSIDKRNIFLGSERLNTA